MKTKFLFFALLFTGFVSYAQQDAQYTQYMYNTINVNPAYAGSRGVTSIFGLHRTQWVGIDGAPTTNAFSINAPLGSNLGGGFSEIVYKDKTSEEWFDLIYKTSMKHFFREEYKLFKSGYVKEKSGGCFGVLLFMGFAIFILTATLLK